MTDGLLPPGARSSTPSPAAAVAVARLSLSALLLLLLLPAATPFSSSLPTSMLAATTTMTSTTRMLTSMSTSTLTTKMMAVPWRRPMAAGTYSAFSCTPPPRRRSLALRRSRRWVDARSSSSSSPSPPNFRSLTLPNVDGISRSDDVDVGSAERKMAGKAEAEAEAEAEKARVWFSLRFRDGGTCVGVALRSESVDGGSDGDRRGGSPPPPLRLHPVEYEWGRRLAASETRSSYYLGRMAARAALATEEERVNRRSGTPPSPRAASLRPMLRGPFGRPDVPAGYLGSISHKDGKFAAALVVVAEAEVEGGGASTERGNGRGVGVDLERVDRARGRRIARRVLTDRERASLGGLEAAGSFSEGESNGGGGVSADEEVMLRFSLKESVYKAIHPLVNEYVGFQEAEVYPRADGAAHVSLCLKSGKHESLGLIVEASWKTVTAPSKGGGAEAAAERFFLTSASALATHAEEGGEGSTTTVDE